MCQKSSLLKKKRICPSIIPLNENRQKIIHQAKSKEIENDINLSESMEFNEDRDQNDVEKIYDLEHKKAHYIENNNSSSKETKAELKSEINEAKEKSEKQNENENKAESFLIKFEHFKQNKRKENDETIKKGITALDNKEQEIDEKKDELKDIESPQDINDINDTNREKSMKMNQKSKRG